MPSGTKYQAYRTDELASNNVHLNCQGFSSSVTAGTSTNIDYVLTDDCEITGLNLIIDKAIYGDYLHLQVIDVDGVFSGVPGYILNQFATNWYVSPTMNIEIQSQYPAKLYTGMTLRAVFISTGNTDNVFIALNYKLHKILA